MTRDPFEYGRIHNLPPGVTLNDIDPPDEAEAEDFDPNEAELDRYYNGSSYVPPDLDGYDKSDPKGWNL